MSRFIPEPLVVTCDTCGKSAETFNGADPDSALACPCCPVEHNHAGLGCRTITISGRAYLTIFDINDLMEAAGFTPDAAPVTDEAASH